MSTTVYSFWLVKNDGDSYISRGQYSFEGSPNGTVEDLLRAARGHIVLEEKQLSDNCDLRIELHQVLQLQIPVNVIRHFNGSTAR